MPAMISKLAAAVCMSLAASPFVRAADEVDLLGACAIDTSSCGAGMCCPEGQRTGNPANGKGGVCYGGGRDACKLCGTDDSIPDCGEEEQPTGSTSKADGTVTTRAGGSTGGILSDDSILWGDMTDSFVNQVSGAFDKFTAAHVVDVPRALIGVSYFAPFQSQDAGDSLFFNCPAAVNANPDPYPFCDIWVFQYRCPTCQGHNTGDLPAHLIAQGFHPTRCAPKFRVSATGEKHSMTAFRMQLGRGQAYSIFIQQDDTQWVFGATSYVTVPCDTFMDEQTCGQVSNSDLCKWDAAGAGKCEFDACPIIAQGPHVGGQCNTCANDEALAHNPPYQVTAGTR